MEVSLHEMEDAEGATPSAHPPPPDKPEAADVSARVADDSLDRLLDELGELPAVEVSTEGLESDAASGSEGRPSPGSDGPARPAAGPPGVPPPPPGRGSDGASPSPSDGSATGRGHPADKGPPLRPDVGNGNAAVGGDRGVPAPPPRSGAPAVASTGPVARPIVPVGPKVGPPPPPPARVDAATPAGGPPKSQRAGLPSPAPRSPYPRPPLGEDGARDEIAAQRADAIKSRPPASDESKESTPPRSGPPPPPDRAGVPRGQSPGAEAVALAPPVPGSRGPSADPAPSARRKASAPPVLAAAAAPVRAGPPRRDPSVRFPVDSAMPQPSPPPARGAQGEPLDQRAQSDEAKRFVAAAQSLVKLCEDELGSQSDPLRAARLHFEVARLYESPLTDPRRAAAHYQEAYARAPEHIPTIRGLRRVLISRKGFQTALPLFDAEARLVPEPRAKAALYFAKGRLLEDVVGNKNDARKAYATALDLDRADPAVLKAMEQCDLEQEAWGALARTYEREANAVASDPRHRAALIVQRARLLEVRQADSEAAIELYETALRLDPHVHGALPALKRLHYGRRRWRDLIRVLEREAEQTSDATVRTMALYRIGRLHAERLGNQAEARAALERAARESPDDPLVLGELARLYEAGECWEDLCRVLGRLVEIAPEADERLGLLHRIGQISEERLGDPPTAADRYEAALEIQPTYVPALQALGKLYTELGRWPDLVRMHLAEASATEDARRRAVAHARVAEIFEVHLDDPEQATDHHAKALSQVPGYPPSFKALTRLLAAAGRWRELVEVYERAVDAKSSDDRTVTYLLTVGAIFEDHLGEPVQAAHAYRRVLSIDANHLGAIHALQRATERGGRFAELVEALELEAEKTRDEDQIVALLHRAGEIFDEKLGDRDAALSRFRKVLAINPKYVPALTSLGRIYYRTGRWHDLLDMYKRELELTPQGPVAVALLHKMGELCEERVGADDEAISHYRRALEIDPTHGPALRALSRMLRDRQEWADLVKLLELELSGHTDPDARARTAYRVAQVYEEHLGQVDRALSAYELALRSKADYRPAIDAVSRLRAERSAWAKLIEDLEREANTTPDPVLAVSAVMRQGETWAEQIGEPRRAIACFEKVLERDASHLGALLAIEPLYRKVGAWEALAATYGAQARALRDPAARATALRELARLQETRSVGHDQDPRATYEAVLGLLPDDPTALVALENTALLRGDRRLLAAVDRRLIAAADDPTVASAYQMRLAESLEVIGDPGALEAYRAALAVDPESLGATRGMSRIAEQTDDPVALAEAARREAAVARNGEAAARLLVQSARVRTERLGDTSGAIVDLERALELWPDDQDAAERLSRMLLAARQEARLADLLARAAGSATTPERIAALLLEVARIQSELLDNLPGAIGALNRVLRAAPNHVPTLRQLADLYERDGQWTEAVNLLGRVVTLAPDRESLRDAHLELAAIWDERLGETSRALVSLQAVLALDSDNREALARLANLQEREGKLAQAAATAQRLVEASHDDDDRAEALLVLSRVEDALGNAQGSVTALAQAVALSGPGSEAALEFKALCQTPTDWERYLNALGAHLERQHGLGLDTVPTYLEISRVRFDQVGQPTAAIEVLRAGLDATGGALPIRVELTTRLRLARRHGEAVIELQRLLDADLTRVETWRDLARTYQEMERPNEARLALLPLIVMGTATRAHIEYVARIPPQPAAAQPASLTSDVLAHLGPLSPPDQAATTLLEILVEGLGKLYPPDLEAYGLSPRDRMTTRQGHPVRSLADRIAAIFGVPEFELFLHRARTHVVNVELSNPPSLLVPNAVAEMPIAAQVYMLAGPMANIAQRVHAVDKLTPRELEVLLASVTRNVRPGYGSGLTSEDFLDEQAKRIYKALPRRARRAVEEAANQYADSPRVDFPRWAASMQRRSQRVALLVADDLASAIEVLQRTERDLAGLDGATLISNSEVAADLVRFWISETAIRLRQRMGLIPADGRS